MIERALSIGSAGQVIGWAQGRRVGVRAPWTCFHPGRSRTRGQEDTVNIKIKYREPFCPFAPSVPVERAADFVDFPDWRRLLPRRFMLMVAPVRPKNARSSSPP
ncbi:MAG: hypothetical protein IPN23_07590 [Elusimicrobia bacterium]|nr:hypothetical protein [Elusimicrobiota bacterium]